MSQSKRSRSRHIPQRTCIVCRQKIDKRCLTRIVRTADAGVVVDATGKRNGRGAYVCDQPACWHKVVNSNLLDQALITEVTQEEKDAIHKCGPVAQGEFA